MDLALPFKAVLTLKFDDIVRPVEGAQIFTEKMTENILSRL